MQYDVVNTVRPGLTPKRSGAATDYLDGSGAWSVPANITSGTYTPTLTAVANLDSVTGHVSQYLRVGSVVTVSGQFEVNPTLTATITQFSITVPVNSTFANTFDGGGTAYAVSIAGMGAAIYADTATANQMQVRFVSSDINENTMMFHFTYRVI